MAELGYVFRDLPWKTLDLFTEKTADAGLLDVFSITDEPAMTAGRVNLNTQQAPVLQSILAGTIWDEISSSTVTMSGVSAQSAATIAANITSATSTNSLTNKSSINYHRRAARDNSARNVTRYTSRQSNRQGSEGSCPTGNFFRFPNARLEFADRCGSAERALSTRRNGPQEIHCRRRATLLGTRCD